MLIQDDEGAIKGALQQAGVTAIPSTVDEVGANGAGVMDLLAYGLRHGEANDALRPLLAALDEGLESVALQVLGDSTGNDTDEWVYLTTQYLATLYPAYTVKHQLFNDGTQAYDAPTVIQTGPLGARYLQGTASTTTHVIPAAEIPWFANDIDVRAKVAPDLWIPGSICSIVARFGGAGFRGFDFGINSSGTLYWSWSTDGTASTFSTSSATAKSAAGLTDGQPYWLRVTHKMDNGASGHTITFWYSPDGITYTQLGTTVVTAGAIAGLFNPGSTIPWEVGGRGGTAEPFVGKIYEVDIKDGIAGLSLAPQGVDGWQPFSTTAMTYGGSPQLTVVNGSVPGMGISYLSDSTRFPKLSPKWGQRAVLLSCSHNDGAQYGPTYLAQWDAWLTLIRARFPAAAVAVLSQNPRIFPTSIYVREHAVRRSQLMAWAFRNGCAHIDTYRAFRLDGRAISSLVDATDGVHPTPPLGRTLWATTVQHAMLGRRI